MPVQTLIYAGQVMDDDKHLDHYQVPPVSPGLAFSVYMQKITEVCQMGCARGEKPLPSSG